jgi:signal transduction histidine kinase
VSHELRTPLTSISASLGLLAGGAAGPLPAPAQRLLTIAQANGERLVRLINDILDIEKMESGEPIFDLKPVDIGALVEQAIEAHRDYAGSHGVDVKLGSPSSDAIVIGDADRLNQVLTNLLSNAVKFSSLGKPVVVSIESGGSTVRICVRDYGPGIPDSYRDRIFDKFVQVDATDARRRGGTRLGLSIVREIVNRLGGRVGFEPALDGTIFFVELPKAQSAAQLPVGQSLHRPVSPSAKCDADTVAAAIVANQRLPASCAG